MIKSLSLKDGAKGTIFKAGTYLQKTNISKIAVRVDNNFCIFELYKLDKKRSELFETLVAEKPVHLFHYLKQNTPMEFILHDDKALADFEGTWPSGIKKIMVQSVTNQENLINFLTHADCSVLELYSHCPIEVDRITSVIKYTMFKKLIIKGVNDSILPAVMDEHTLFLLAIKCANVEMIELRNNRANAISIKNVVHFIYKAHFARAAHLHIENVSGTRAELEKAMSEIKSGSREFVETKYRNDWKSPSYVITGEAYRWNSKLPRCLYTIHLSVTIHRTSDEYEGDEEVTEM